MPTILFRPSLLLLALGVAACGATEEGVTGTGSGGEQGSLGGTQGSGGVSSSGGASGGSMTTGGSMASGGSGDVLTGMIGGFLARRWPLPQASVAGVYLHGLAADALAEEMGQTGIMPSELLSVLPLLTSSLARGKWPLETPPPEEDFCHPL